MKGRMKYSSHSVPILISLLTLACLQLSACGKSASSFVTGAAVSGSTVNNELYANVTLDLNTGGLTLPSFELPIANPSHPEINYGRLQLKPILSGGEELTASVNLSQIAHVPGLDGHLLPNGTALPVGGLDKMPVIAIPIGGDGVMLYLAASGNTLVVGSAIPIREFSALGKYVGGLNFFPAFNLGNKIQGVAGIYTGNGVGQNGIAFFVDASSVLPANSPQPSSPSVLAANVSALRSASVAVSPQIKLQFGGVTPSSRMQQKVSRGLAQIQDDQNGHPLSVGH